MFKNSLSGLSSKKGYFQSLITTTTSLWQAINQAKSRKMMRIQTILTMRHRWIKFLQTSHRSKRVLISKDFQSFLQWVNKTHWVRLKKFLQRTKRVFEKSRKKSQQFDLKALNNFQKLPARSQARTHIAVMKMTSILKLQHTWTITSGDQNHRWELKTC